MAATREPSLLDDREWRGVWWDARDPESRVAGVLTFTGGVSEIQLLGRLPNIGSEPPQFVFAPDRPRINGLTVDGRTITLHRCRPLGATIGSGVPQERHRADVLLIGAAYEPEEEVLLDELRLRFTHLDHWAGISGFASDVRFDEDQKTIESLSVTYRPPSEISVAASDGTNVSIGFSWSWSGSAIVTTDAEIKQRAQARIAFPKPTELSAAIAYATKLRNFLSLGVGRPVHALTVHGVVLANEAVGQDRLSLEILFAPSDEPSPADIAEEVLPHEMPFGLDTIGASLPVRLDSWLSKYDTVKPALDLYFAVAYGATRFLEPRFLSLAQAIETFHRRSSTQQAGKAEPTLRARLSEILSSCPPVAAKLVPDQAAFLDAVVRGRNYYTHYDSKLEAVAPTGISLLPLTWQLRSLLEMCFLMAIGFDDSEIDQIFERSRRYEEVAHWSSVASTAVL